MKKTIALLLALAMALALCACGGNDAEAPAETEAPAAPAQEATEAPAVEETEAATEPSGLTYTVTVVDEGGNPVAGTLLQLCQGEVCLMPVATDENGVAVFTATEEGAYEAKFLSGVPAGYEYTTEEEVFHFPAGSYELTITLKAVA